MIDMQNDELAWNTPLCVHERYNKWYGKGYDKWYEKWYAMYETLAELY